MANLALCTIPPFRPSKNPTRGGIPITSKYIFKLLLYSGAELGLERHVQIVVLCTHRIILHLFNSSMTINIKNGIDLLHDHF